MRANGRLKTETTGGVRALPGATAAVVHAGPNGASTTAAVVRPARSSAGNGNGAGVVHTATAAGGNGAGDAVLIIGTPERTEMLYREIRAAFGQLDEAGAAGARGLHDIEAGGNGLQRFDPDKLERMLLESGVSEVIVDGGLGGNQELADALIACRFRGVRVHDSVGYFEDLEQKVWLEALSKEWLMFSEGFNHSRAYRLVKHALDFVCALALMVAGAPLLGAIAIAIRLDSRGPVLFKQERIGLNGEPFMLYKFRSMRDDAEKDTGPVWAGVDDDRVTRVGALLRKFRLDELPQVINVVRNELSFVGPRPERPCFVELLREEIPFYDVRHLLKPGITGWAQVSYPYGGSVEDAAHKLEYDLWYAKHASIGTDLRVLLKTVKVVLFGKGR
jgi:exopolysaccharide biosynthesis polyprenyl glycosylphosphotransferase